MLIRERKQNNENIYHSAEVDLLETKSLAVIRQSIVNVLLHFGGEHSSHIVAHEWPHLLENLVEPFCSFGVLYKLEIRIQKKIE